MDVVQDRFSPIKPSSHLSRGITLAGDWKTTMSKIENVTFIGDSGSEYTFASYPKGTVFNDVGGVYVFTKQYRDRQSVIRYAPLYIGQTESFSDRLTESHEKWDCAEENGYNTVCVYVDQDEESRLSIERDLLKNYRTPCNEQYPSNKSRWSGFLL